MITIGIAGTAKNTGKTTALVAMLGQAVRKGLRLGLTGIGYDGEERDTVTLLPKPRILVPAGALVTTSESCLESSGARWTGLRRTGLRTALGEVVVVRVIAPGLLVIAGPNKTHELERVRELLAAEGIELLMVDGSLNRIAPMAVADRVVFSTGAARSTDLRMVAEEMGTIESLFALPSVSDERGRGGANRGVAKGSGVSDGRADVVGTADEEAEWPVLTAGTSRLDVVRASEGSSPVIRWKGLVALDPLKAVVSVAGRRRATVVVDDPLKLLVAGEIRRVAEVVAAARSAGTGLACVRAPRLAAVTSNPFYPVFDGTVYSGGAVEAGRLQDALRAVLHVPVVDVVRDGGEALFTAAWDNLTAAPSTAT